MLYLFPFAANHQFFLDCPWLSHSWWHAFLLPFLYGSVMATSFGFLNYNVQVLQGTIKSVELKRFVLNEFTPCFMWAPKHCKTCYTLNELLMGSRLLAQLHDMTTTYGHLLLLTSHYLILNFRILSLDGYACGWIQTYWQSWCDPFHLCI